MKREAFDHNTIQGCDKSIEIALKEYGFAWIKNGNGPVYADGNRDVYEEQTLFYYGVKMERGEWTEFQYATLDNNIDVKTEYNWADFDGVRSFVGVDLDWFDMPLELKVQDLLSYYGFQNVFGTCCSDGFEYKEIVPDHDVRSEHKIWHLLREGRREYEKRKRREGVV